MAFVWNEKFAFGIKEIDEQHKKIFEIGYKLYLLASSNDNYDKYDEIMEIIHELADYTVYHFSCEEKLMRDYGYDDYLNHSFEHKFFIKKVEKIASSNLEDNQKESILQIINFVGDWVSSHILVNDVKYTKFFNEKGLS